MQMTGPRADKGFGGSIPEVCDTYRVPLIFESYAQDLGRRLAARRPGRVLEIAAGTGVATRAMATALRSGLFSLAAQSVRIDRPVPDRRRLRTPARR